jgi:DNA-binding transcriptional MerR regulator
VIDGLTFRGFIAFFVSWQPRESLCCARGQPSHDYGKVERMPKLLTVSAAAAETGWSPRMLRYLEEHGLVAPWRTSAGYRQYGLSELNRLRSLRELRRRFGIELVELAFARRLHRERELRRAVDAWLATGDDSSSWVEWEQRKQERLLAA